MLDVIPTYLMSLFPIPVSVEKKFNRMRSQFLWEGKAERKKYHLVKWQELIKDKKGGGLGVKNLKPHNKSLSFKWLWRYNDGGEKIWKQVIDIIYGREGFWAPRAVSIPSKTGVWKQISRLWPEFQKFISLKVGNGSRIRF